MGSGGLNRRAALAFCSDVDPELQLLFLPGHDQHLRGPLLPQLLRILILLTYLDFFRLAFFLHAFVSSKRGSRDRLFLSRYQTRFFIMKLFFRHMSDCIFLLFLHCLSCCSCPLVLFPALKSGLSFISFLGRCRQFVVSFWPIYLFFSSFLNT